MTKLSCLSVETGLGPLGRTLLYVLEICSCGDITETIIYILCDYSRSKQVWEADAEADFLQRLPGTKVFIHLYFENVYRVSLGHQEPDPTGC